MRLTAGMPAPHRERRERGAKTHAIFSMKEDPFLERKNRHFFMARRARPELSVTEDQGELPHMTRQVLRASSGFAPRLFPEASVLLPPGRGQW